MKTVLTLHSLGRRSIFFAPVLGSLLALGGCAGALPAQDADFGDPRPLMNLVMAGQIEPNTPLPARTDGSVTLTPLCAMLGYLTSAPAVDVLLNKGADVNRPCRTRSGGDAFNRALAALNETPELPLDIVIAAAISRGTIPSPYTANPMYRPQDLPALYASADKLIQRGARSKTGSMSLEQIKQRVNKGIDAGNQNVAEQKERLAERNKNSIFNAETLGAVVAIAGATASNYAAQSNQRNSQAAGAALPLAQLQPIPSSTKATAVASSAAGLSGGNTRSDSAAPTMTVTPSPVVGMNDRIYFAYTAQLVHSEPVCSTEGPTDTHGPLAKIKPLPVRADNAPWDLMTPQPVTKAACEAWIQRCLARQEGSLCH